MKIGVGSTNPVKVAAVQSAVEFVFSRRGESVEYEVQGYSVESGVSDQPYSDDETRQGARNRALAVLEADPSVDMAFGLEGGLMSVGEELQSIVWVHIEDRAGKQQSLAGNRFALPQYIVDGLASGEELGKVMDKIEGKTNTNQQGGMFGYLTEGVIPREEAYAYLVRFALALWLSGRKQVRDRPSGL
ncbi:DUF84 family protein [Candidatus Woesebacteria bacterium]|nr:DUF84 family protein [Candidatus Woesebacteria bacterium]MCD8527236.1 DUF84 family protein [Candidatus Woesebacteria bacterium]MCD8546602.1 DUF84 family protein [Candidatus Woesebacteria bacterium]